MARKILIWGYYGFSNCGDDMLLAAVVKALKNNNPTDRLFYTSGGLEVGSFVAANAEGLNFFCLRQKNSFFRKFELVFRHYQLSRFCANVDYVVFGGGTQFYESERNGIKPFFLKWFVIFYAWFFFKTKIVYLGVGIGKLQSFLSKFFQKQLLKMAHFAMFRDRNSFSLALSLTPSLGEKFDLGRDLCCYAGGPFPFERNVKSSGGKIKVGLNFLDYYSHVESNPEKQSEYCNELIGLVEELGRSCEVYLFSMQTTGGGNDNEFLKYLSSCGELGAELILYNSGEFESHIAKILEMDVLFGMRYHFVLTGICAGIPTGALSYQSKVAEEMSDNGLAEYCVEMDAFNASSVIAVVDKLNCRLTDSCEHIQPVGCEPLSVIIEKVFLD